MKEYFRQDKVMVGLLTSVGVVVLTAALTLLVLTLAGVPLMPNFRFMALGFVPAIIIFRFYVKAKQYPTVVRTQIIAIFACFIIFLYFNQQVAAIAL